MASYSLDALQAHLEYGWEAKAERIKWNKGPMQKLDSQFCVLEFPPTDTHDFWIYSTLGMSLERADEHLIELHLFSSVQDHSLVELLAVTASYHRNHQPLGLHHTVNFGRSWQANSACSFGFISLPYLDGEVVEILNFQAGHLHNLWLIPITEQEREYKIKYGWNALEELFEEKEFNYLDPFRQSLI